MKINFVEADHFPEILEQNTVYISHQFQTAAHLCCCGCGNQVVTPFQMGWQVSVTDGLVTISPSIGNYKFPCKSHYWIQKSEVKWC